jgi:hypothetical protein
MPVVEAVSRMDGGGRYEGRLRGAALHDITGRLDAMGAGST